MLCAASLARGELPCLGASSPGEAAGIPPSHPRLRWRRKLRAGAPSAAAAAGRSKHEQRRASASLWPLGRPLPDEAMAMLAEAWARYPDGELTPVDKLSHLTQLLAPQTDATAAVRNHLVARSVWG